MFSMLALATLAANPAVAQPLEPTGKWVVEYDDDMCVLARSYGEGKGRITLALRPYPMGTETEVVLITLGGPASMDNGKAELTLLPATHVAQGSYRRYFAPKLSVRLARLTLDQDALRGIENTASMIVKVGDRDSYALATPGIAAGTRALATCQADLLKGWGIDPAERGTVVTPPKGNPAMLFGADAYPAEAIRAHQEGRTVAVATISGTGAVTGCAVASTSHSPALDQATCNVLRKARFAPGLDKDGQPIAAHLVVPVHWVLPS